MSLPIILRKREEFISAIDRSLKIADDIFDMIRDYKITQMMHFLRGELQDSVLEEDIEMRLHPYRWPIARLEDLTTLDDGMIMGPGDLSIYNDYHENEGVPVIESEFVTGLRFRAEKYQYLREDVKEIFSEFIVYGADILLITEGRDVGSSTIFPISHRDGMLGSNCIRIRVNVQKCETFYLLNILHYYYNTGVLNSIQNSESGKIEIDLIKQLSVPLPPMDEQKRITDSLLNLSGYMVAQETYRDSMQELMSILDRD